MKFYKYRAYAVFGIYQFYKLTYISLVKGAKEVAKLLNEPIYEIKECEMFAIQSKKFYKKFLPKKEVNVEREYKMLFRSYKTYKFFYFWYGYDLTTNLQIQRSK